VNVETNIVCLPESFLEQKWSADGGIHATRDHNNVRSVLINTQKKLHRAGHSEQNLGNADIWCKSPPLECMFAYSCSNSSTTGVFQLGIV
jgi:hypothetical protein